MDLRQQLRTVLHKIRHLPFGRYALWTRVGLCALGAGAIFIGGLEVGNGQVGAFFSSHPSDANINLPAHLNYASVNAVYEALRQNYNGKLTATQLTDGLKAGLAQATNDPYTEYFTPIEAKTFSAELNNSFSGIGVGLGQDSDGKLIVVAPIKGSPADKAGLKAQDVITSINGTDSVHLAPDKAGNDIRGQQGTSVTLKVLRYKTQNLDFTIVRENIQLPSVTSKILSNNIGYMQISSFADDTSSLASQVANQFGQAKVRGIILDLRGNPGGRVDAAINISSLWLRQGQTVATERGTIGSQTLSATGNDLLHGIPLVVLIDGGSASASEITASALRDNGAAHIIGVRSFGKGVVQQLVNFQDGSALKVTVASWYRPDGQNIQKKGITPDQVVGLSDGDASAHNDTQLSAAEAYLAPYL